MPLSLIHISIIKSAEKITNDVEPKEDPVVEQEQTEAKEPAQDAVEDDKTAKKQALIDKAKEWLLADQANRLTPYMALMGKHKAVSYTHLDVYKRQVSTRDPVKLKYL